MTWMRKPWIVCVLTFAVVVAAPLSAQQGPPTFSTEVVNTSANPVPVVVTGADPVPVVVTGARVEQLVFFRDGYQVPAGKMLLVDDVSVSCRVVSVLPHGNNQTTADFERFGLATSAQLAVSYATADCPEPLVPGLPGFPDQCRVQSHIVGTAQSHGGPTFEQTADGRPVAFVHAGRAMSVFADPRGTLRASCAGNLQGASLTGTGRLVDKP